MNWELNQHVGLEKLVRKPPTSIFDMPSSRRYEAKHAQMLPRATPEETYESLAGPEISYSEHLLFFLNKKVKWHNMEPLLVEKYQSFFQFSWILVSIEWNLMAI